MLKTASSGRERRAFFSSYFATATLVRSWFFAEVGWFMEFEMSITKRIRLETTRIP